MFLTLRFLQQATPSHMKSPPWDWSNLTSPTGYINYLVFLKSFCKIAAVRIYLTWYYFFLVLSALFFL